LDVYRAEFERLRLARKEQLRQDATASARAMAGWGAIESDEDWTSAVERAREEYESGQFLLEQLGGERDPTLTAVALTLRRGFIAQYGAEGPADLMCIDLALISYFHALRITGWIGNFAQLIESEFFGVDGLSVNYAPWDRKTHPPEVSGFKVQEFVERIGEELMPLLDRANRMMLRNLKALDDRRRPTAPNLNIGSAGQVNVGQQQVNMLEKRSESR
jgi:hypothetical protein